MTLYTIALFLHIVGAVGLFVSLAFEWIGWGRMRRATTLAEATTWLGVVSLSRRVGPAALLLILVPGLYMTATVWGWVGWILVALATMVLIAAIGGLSTGRLYPGVARAARAAGDRVTPELAARMSAPLLVASVRVRAALALGVVLVMTTKPETVEALAIIGLAAALGLASTRVGAGRDPFSVGARLAQAPSSRR